MQDETARTASCGSKLFLAGEYGVLVGLPAWVLSVEPLFKLAVNKKEKKPFPFHPESPAGKWMKMNSDLDFSWTWQDPHQSKGGWGGSTAEYLLTRAALGMLGNWQHVWEDYRSLFTNGSGVPSGADLVAQILGGCVEFKIGETPLAVTHAGIRETEIFQNLLVFRAAGKIVGRKIQTHSHLAMLDEQGGVASKLSPILNQYDKLLETLRVELLKGNCESFGIVLKDIASLLNQVGLEHPSAREERLILSELPGVLGVKGLGALLSDGIIVLLKSELRSQEPWDYEKILSTAQALGLELLNSEPLQLAKGIIVE